MGIGLTGGVFNIVGAVMCNLTKDEMAIRFWIIIVLLGIIFISMSGEKEGNCGTQKGKSSLSSR
jgi:hypothetical protein